MPTSIDEMIRRMHAYRDTIEDEVVGPLVTDLQRIFGRAETELAKRQTLFTRFALETNGTIQKTVENVEEAARILQEVRGDVDRWIVGPGREWVNGGVSKIHAAGRELTRINMDVRFVSPDLIRSAMQGVSVAERAALKVGYQDLYSIVGTVGDDVSEWFRREMTTAVIEGIPVQGTGDSLTNRLIESGKLRPVEIRTQNGRLVRRSLKQRAQTIARVESARIVNHTHETLATEILGDEAVYINSNPRDSRTTDICRRASARGPMTLKDWDDSNFGRPPRLRPFHMCRSVLIGGQATWFEGRAAA